jgi:hypothetical protein
VSVPASVPPPLDPDDPPVPPLPPVAPVPPEPPPPSAVVSTVLMVQALPTMTNNGPQTLEKDTRMFFSMKKQH